jgi:hypothetical protein
VNEFTARDLIGLAERYQLKTAATRRYGLLLPSTGRLPYRWQLALERRFSAGPLSSVAADALIVFRKMS